MSFVQKARLCMLPFCGAVASVLLATSAAAQDGTDTCVAPTALTTDGAFAFNTAPMVTGPHFSEGACGSWFYSYYKDMFWVYTATATGYLSVDTNGSSFDTVLSIYSGSDCTATCIAEDDDGGYGEQSAIDNIPVTLGDLILIQVGGAVPLQFGLGNLNIYSGPPVDPCMNPDDGFEENDDCASAAVLVAGTYLGLHVEVADPDFYVITVPANHIMTWGETADTGNTRYNLYDAGCVNLLFSNASSTIVRDNTGATSIDYVVEAFKSFSPDDCGAYDIVLTIVPDPCFFAPDDLLEENDDCATAAPIVDGIYGPLFVSKADKDNYSFCVGNGDLVIIDALFTAAFGDIDLFLWDATDPNCGGGNIGFPGTQLARSLSHDDDEHLGYFNNTGGDLEVILEVSIYEHFLNPDCNNYDLLVFGSSGCLVPVGTTFCDPANNNSTGGPAVLSGSAMASGTTSAGLHLEGSGGPPDQFGYVLAGTTSSDPGLNVSLGRLCVSFSGGGILGRYNIPGDRNSLGQFDGAGVFQNLVGTSTSGSGFDVPSTVPFPGDATILAGDTLHFQVWYRDGMDSNFSNGLTDTF
jgi:hypothetical protein